ncbi:hypothetical protein BDV26DRAFT_264322 [Aspergillus bertholletiae]|uniref:Uncharacterized protein n=1 Tax=Aspergillus bertholletiae TaxID=1226010 RepID=A0A5N7B503_9EURO|nr:hypothetical protein BDV26DRAFT_264322 [Aspergillus bertholletiae]
MVVFVDIMFRVAGHLILRIWELLLLLLYMRRKRNGYNKRLKPKRTCAGFYSLDINMRI